jgi:hypothetical protein
MEIKNLSPNSSYEALFLYLEKWQHVFQVGMGKEYHIWGQRIWSMLPKLTDSF